MLRADDTTDLVGGVASVTLGDEEARSRGTQKSVLERRGPPTFPIVVELRDRGAWVAHDTAESVDTLLVNKIPKVQLRLREEGTADLAEEVTCFEVAYDQVEAQILAQMAGSATCSSGGSEAVAAAAAAAEATNTSSIDELVSSLLSSRGGGSGNASPAGSADYGGGDAAWSSAALERFRGLPEADALQELQVLRYISGQAAGVLRPRGPGGFAVGSRAGGVAAGGGGAAASGSSKKKKRVTKANAKRG